MATILDIFWHIVSSIQQQSGPLDPINNPLHDPNSSLHPLRSPLHTLHSPLNPLNSSLAASASDRLQVLQELLDTYVEPYV